MVQICPELKDRFVAKFSKKVPNYKFGGVLELSCRALRDVIVKKVVTAAQVRTQFDDFHEVRSLPPLLPDAVVGTQALTRFVHQLPRLYCTTPFCAWVFLQRHRASLSLPQSNKWRKPLTMTRVPTDVLDFVVETLDVGFLRCTNKCTNRELTEFLMSAYMDDIPGIPMLASLEVALSSATGGPVKLLRGPTVVPVEEFSAPPNSLAFHLKASKDPPSGKCPCGGRIVAQVKCNIGQSKQRLCGRCACLLYTSDAADE